MDFTNAAVALGGAVAGGIIGAGAGIARADHLARRHGEDDPFGLGMAMYMCLGAGIGMAVGAVVAVGLFT